MRLNTALGDGFPVTIEYDVDSNGEVEDLSVFTLGGLCLDDLIYGSSLQDAALELAEADKPPPSTKWLRENA